MNLEKELIDVCHQWDTAMKTNDADKIGEFMSDDWLIIGSGGITEKTSFLALIRSGDLTHSVMDSDEMLIRIYGDTGIAISKGTSAGTFQGESFDLYEWSTSVFVRMGDTFRCVSTTLTPARRSP